MMPVRPASFAPFVLAVLLAAGTTTAQVVYRGTLSGDNEVPPNASTGSGSATVTYDPANFQMTVSVEFTGLTGTTTAAHIHCCVAGPGINIGIASPTPSFPSFPTGISSGIYANTFNLDSAASFNPSFVAANGSVEAARNALVEAMGRRGAYFNLHTKLFPAGELRADLAEVPIFANGFQQP